MGKKYSLESHPSDIAVKARANNEKELFANAAQGMFAVMFDLRRIRPARRADLSVERKQRGGDEDAMVLWLEEILYLFEAGKWVFRRFDVSSIEAGGRLRIDGFGWGEPLDRSRHKMKIGIKAVTYNQLSISKDNGWEAKVVFDV